ncbi:hypothetical protein RhiirA1_465618 [Rhizophagus irregularis]|uniref:Uncharacterized protein n=1 Tax=Rhizophagus irregularis TaxID=588596 RepID=A0A2N0RFP9_9GLOM|nr:hypothetical protein RhiirA1_465618 [Rhizophagus irregularis]GET65164.1 hypothetical protein RIR_e28784_A0A2N0RFP9_9GLOM [Rhizophagus irregularis DAOM 181602=DAOM 197198]
MSVIWSRPRSLSSNNLNVHHLLLNQNDDNDEEYAEIFNEFIDEYIVDFLCKENLNDNKEKGYPMITQINELLNY